MPTYEYLCESKHQVFEVQQSIKDEPLTICPHCKDEGVENPVKKLISTSGFILQGGGWASSGYSK
jgi:putative FmdB family regulatory protein